MNSRIGEQRVAAVEGLRFTIFHMPTTDHTLDQILSLAATHFKVPREKLTPDDDFFKTLGIDSLQALDLLTRLENHFHVELPDYELQGVTDFRTLASRIQARL
jgi:acyl carrier protein